MGFLYAMERGVVYPTGRWAIRNRGYGDTLYFEVYRLIFFGIIKKVFWADTDDLFEVNECTTNG